MKRTYRAKWTHPLLALFGTALLIYALVRIYDPERIARTVTFMTFVIAVTAEAVLRFVRIEFELDGDGFSFRERKLWSFSRLRRVSFDDIERLRIKGRCARLKLLDDQVVMIRLGFLPRSDREEILDVFRELPQHVEDPFADALAAMPKRSE